MGVSGDVPDPDPERASGRGTGPTSRSPTECRDGGAQLDKTRVELPLRNDAEVARDPRYLLQVDADRTELADRQCGFRAHRTAPNAPKNARCA
jgi:hypothetical protein